MRLIPDGLSGASRFSSWISSGVNASDAFAVPSRSLEHRQPEDAPPEDTKHREQIGEPLCGPQPRLLGLAARLQHLVENFYPPAQRIPLELLDCLRSRCDLKVRDQLPFNRIATSWFASLGRMQHSKLQRGIPVLFVQRRLHQDTPEL